MLAVARLFAREAIEKIYINFWKIINGVHPLPDELSGRLASLSMHQVFKEYLTDMDLIAQRLVS